MNKVIIDSSAIVSLSLTRDSNFKKAVEISNIMKKNNQTILLPQEVFAESMNVIGKKLGHTKAVEVGSDILTSELFYFIYSDEQIMKKALIKLRKSSASVSYSDCLVMATADLFETKIIFGFDEVFRKNGYYLPGDE